MMTSIWIAVRCRYWVNGYQGMFVGASPIERCQKWGIRGCAEKFIG